MFLFICSFFIHASPLHDALLYQDVDILLQSNEQEDPQYWRVMANITPQTEHLYSDTSTQSITTQLAQTDALFLSSTDPVRILEVFLRSQESDPEVQGRLLLALAKHGNCSILPYLSQALTISHPLRLPAQTKDALYGLGILATRESCDFSKEVDLLLPMLHSFSTERRKGAAFALSKIQPKWSDPTAIWKASIREPHPRVRSWLIQSTKNTKPTEELELKWFSDPDQGVRLQTIATHTQSPLLEELLKDNELWVLLETIRALGKRGDDLGQIIKAGANISAEEQSTISYSRKFAQALVAIEASQNLNPKPLLKTNRPTAVRSRAVGKLNKTKLLQKLMNDKEKAVRAKAAQQRIAQNPEDLDLLFSLLDHNQLEVVFAALYNITKNKEGALEESLWSLLSSPNSLLVRRTLEALSSLELLKSREEAEPILQPLFSDRSISILLPLHRIAYALKIEKEEMNWPVDLEEKRQVNITTEYGRMQAELFIEDAPLTCWQWIEQVLRGDHNQLVVDGDHRYLHFAIDQPLYDVGERNMRPIKRGSILYNPNQPDAEIWISMDDHPEDLGDFVVFGQILEGEELLRQLRPQERLKKIDIIDTSNP
jgi:HEAT repeat protein